MFKRLVLTSPGRSYEVTFHAGVNLIAGPISTGKSSVLELLDYACGSSNAPRYPELTKCSDVLVELIAGGETLTVRRTLKNASEKALLYEAGIDAVKDGETTPIEVLPRHTLSHPSISLAVLERLDLSTFKVKTAPTKGASETSSFSLRDLLLLIYIDQDRMGSKTSFFENDHFKSNKWRAAFEIVHEVFDAGAAALADALRLALKQEEDLVRYLDNARKFLDQFRVPAADFLEKEDQRLGDEITKAQQLQRDHRVAERAELGASNQLAERRNEIAEQDRTLRARIDELRRSARQLGRLRVQYERELGQWEFLSESQAIMGSIPVNRCPACFQDVSFEHDVDHCHLCKQTLQKQQADVPVENRIRAVRRRITDLDGYLEDLSNESKRIEDQRAAMAKSIEEIDQTLRRVQQSTVLASTRAIIETNEAISSLQKNRDQVREQLAYRRRALGDGSNLSLVRERVETLREDERQARESKLSPETVTKDLSAWYQSLLADIDFPALRDAYVDLGTYRPIVRGQPYPGLSSKGAISLAVVMWHFALLEYSLKPAARSRFPKLLMLDSPLSHVGRDSDDPEFRDQKLVDAFYATLVRLHTRADEFQIIMVDNRPPASARDLLAIEFTGTVGRGRFGLIDDEHPLIASDGAKEMDQATVVETDLMDGVRH